jgi:hypothetical protein
MLIDLYIGEDKLEIFGNENITLTSSVTDINDITKNLTDITKSFTVPASDINNQIFKHYYNANIDNTFDARTKVKGRIELDGMPFRYGKYRLEKVKIKGGQPSVYTIQFWGKGINLKDIIGDDELSALDLSAYDHDYNSNNVKLGLTDGLFGGVIKYSMFAKKQYYYNSNGADPIQTSVLSNIAYNSGGVTGVLWNDLKPSIGLINIIEAIENKYSLSFSRDFFGREEFTKLYLWLNNSAKEDVFSNEKRVDFNAGTNPFLNFTTDIATYNYNNYRVVRHNFIVVPKAGYEGVEYIARIYLGGEAVTDSKYVGRSPNLTKTITDDIGEQEVYFTVSTKFGFEYDFIYSVELYTLGYISYTVFANDNFIPAVASVSANMPKIKTMDFLRGLFSMFKLIIKIQDDDEIYVNPIKDYYSAGKLYDITDYVDTDNYEVERGKLLNPINFSFEKPTTLLNTQFELNTGSPYGNEDLLLKDEYDKKLDGDSFEVKLPFEQIVYERLLDINDGENTNIMYAGVFDDKIEGVNPKPHIYYNQNVALGSKSIGFINGSGIKEQINTSLNIPSHTLGFDNPQFSTVWAKEFSEWDGNIISNTLYSNYYSYYITSVFNIKKRSFKYDAVLPLLVQLKLDLNDVIQIKNDYYRIENYNFNLFSGKTEFNLINSFDNTINAFSSDRTTINVNYQAQTESIYVTNGGNFSFNKVDLGNGVGWVTVSSIASNVYFAFDENLTGTFRAMQVEIQNTETLQTILINLNQTGATGITADNNVITADNGIITADNSN